MPYTTQEQYRDTLTILKEEQGDNLIDWCLEDGCFNAIIKHHFANAFGLVQNMSLDLVALRTGKPIGNKDELMQADVYCHFSKNLDPYQMDIPQDAVMTFDEFLTTLANSEPLKKGTQYAIGGTKQAEYMAVKAELMIGLPVAQIAKRYDVARNTVYSIKHEVDIMQDLDHERWLDAEIKKYPTFDDFMKAQEFGDDAIDYALFHEDEDGFHAMIENPDA